jgi:hypothetical protein
MGGATDKTAEWQMTSRPPDGGPLVAVGCAEHLLLPHFWAIDIHLTLQWCKVPDPSFGEVSQELLKSNVAGYVTILDITPSENRMNILSPSPGALPSKYLLIGSVKWME